ncbi:MAG: CofH family radical SAM protein [Desulfosarcinaceae bacterium]|nr:CofH family radical SAM protein [Desulfosarcinaceae bacterium]
MARATPEWHSAPNPPAALGHRYSSAEGLELLQKMPMGELMGLAYAARRKRLPNDIVTFVADTNPNYTNVCESGCRFCAFRRQADDEAAFTHPPEVIAEKVRQAQRRGATTVLLQGGHNPAIGVKDWLAYLRAIQTACPAIHIHPFSPAEMVYMADKEGVPLRDLLQMIYDAGVRTLPGGGAEILSERVRAEIAPAKATAFEWLEVSRLAHEVGFRTTATMMFGHVETDAEIVAHLVALRDLQDRSGGFTSFIPWSFKPGNSPLGQQIQGQVHPAKYIRVIATARLMLDNFPHIQSSWFSESVPAGQMGLLAGADDFGGLLIEENVHLSAGHDRATTMADVLTIIRRSGFTPAQRDSSYRIIKRFDPPTVVGCAVDP